VKTPIARRHARLHFLDGLAPVLLAFQLALRGEDGLDETPFGAVFEFEIQAFDGGTALVEFAA